MVYTYATEKLGNGNKIKYKITEDGTAYHKSTNDEIVKVLEMCRREKIRITVDYGDVKTGKSWEDVFDITGYVGRSTGSIKIPLLIHNTRSMGGGGLLDDCIIKISTSKGKNILYKL